MDNFFASYTTGGSGGSMVTSVFGRTGIVVALAGDYDAIQVDYDNTGSGLTATEVQGAIDELAGMIVAPPVTSVFSRTGAVVAAAGDYTASEVTNVPAGSIAAITVQAALNELDSEKATIALDNLASVAVNADINDNGAGIHNIGSLTNYYLAMRSALFSAPSTGFINIADFADSGNGMLTLGLRTTPSGVTNTTSIATAAGTITEAWRTGSWMSRNRADAVNPTGSLLIETGNNTAASAVSGNIKLRTGTVGGGGTRGDIFFIDGTEGTTGHVWTSVGTGGQGGWAALPAAGANTALSNLSSVAINTSLISDSDSTDDVGSFALKWLNMISTTFKATSLMGLYTNADVNRLILQVGTTPSGVADVPSLVSTSDTSAPSDLPISVRTRNIGSGNASGAMYLETGNQISNANSGLINIKTGVANQTGNTQSSGLINIETGDTDDGASGVITLITGAANDGGSGALSIKSGDTTNSTTGGVLVRTGDAGGAGNGSGGVTLRSGDSDADTGTHVILTGDSTSGASGDIVLQSGTGSTNRGAVQFLSPNFKIDNTITAGGSTGAQTIDKAAGTVNFAAAATSLVVTNAYVTTASLIFVQLRTNDATAVIQSVVPAAGSFTINMSVAPTAETSVGFFVIN